jgi:predicted phosphodiesterase
MKFGIFSDPHINSLKNKPKLFEDFILSMEPSVDGFICSGDWASFDVKEIEQAFKIIRNITQKPILTVFGNHCHWTNQSRDLSLDEVLEYHSDICKKYNITYLEEETFETDTSIITGFNGWYYTTNTGTKDLEMLPMQNSYGANPFHVLMKKALNKLDRAIEIVSDSEKQKVCVTHFSFTTDPLYERKSGNIRHLEQIKEHFNILICGHSHQKHDTVGGSLRIINPGADYYKYDDYFYILDL